MEQLVRTEVIVKKYRDSRQQLPKFRVRVGKVAY